jgi:hypothetical protein
MSRRRHKAAGARVAVTGISAGAVLGIVGAIGANAQPPASHTKRKASVAYAPVRRVPSRPSTPPTTIVWRVVHRTVYVTDPPAVAARAAGSSSWHQSYSATAQSYSPAAPSYSSGAAPVSSPAPAPAPAAAGAAPAPTPAPAAAPLPACSGSKCP